MGPCFTDFIRNGDKELYYKLGSYRRIISSKSNSRSGSIYFEILKLIDLMLIMFLYHRLEYTKPPSDLSTELSE